MKKFVVFIVLLSVLLGTIHTSVFAAGSGPESQYEKGMDYFKNKDYDSAFSYFQISGEVKGYAPAQNMLGVCYRDGLGVEQDLADAERLFALAADQGNPEAKANLDDLKNIMIPAKITPTPDQAKSAQNAAVTNTPEYTITGTVLTISGAEKIDPYYNIPNWYDINKEITEVIIKDNPSVIADNAFSTCTYLENIIIPDSVKEIGSKAFAMCYGLKELALPNQIEKIGRNAFYYCRTLERIELPDKISYVGDGVFKNCSKLQNIILSKDHPYLELTNDALFSKPDNRLIFFLPSYSGAYTIPFGTKIIGTDALSLTHGLTEVIIPDSVTEIREHALGFCRKLVSVTVPASVIKIGNGAFEGCSEQLVITVEKNSYAEEYCKKNDLEYVLLNSEDKKTSDDGQKLKMELDFVIWTESEGVTDIVKEDNMYIENLKESQVYGPRLKITNQSDSILSPEITAKINSKSTSWDIDPINPGYWRGYVLIGSDEGAGTYKYTFYIDGKEVTSGQYTIQEKYKSVYSSGNGGKIVNSYYIVGGTENTFDGLYKKMCINLDLQKHPITIKSSNKWGSEYGSGDREIYEVIKDDSESYEYIGYVCKNGRLSDKEYIIRSWTGYHEHGEKIQMKVYYSTDGKYIGNIRKDLTNNKSNSSSHSPYFIPSEGTHNLK